MMRLLLTGATGFTGNVLLDLLPAAVADVRVTLFMLPGDPGRERVLAKNLKNLEVVYGDIGDEGQVEQAVAGHSHVVHLAGVISYWRRERNRLDQVNRGGVENVVKACLRHKVIRLVHVSSVGALGFHRDGRLADESTAYNWPRQFHYMASKLAGQQIVERAVRERGLQAVILNPASLMGPGDPVFSTPHNQLYHRIYNGRLFGCFAGGLAVADVRDLASIIIKALSGGAVGERYLVAGANVEYREVVRAIGSCFRRKVYPFPIPPFLLAAAGAALEIASGLTGKSPPLTASYGRLSGWYGYYSNRKSVEAFRHRYLPFEQTIADACRYFRETFC